MNESFVITASDSPLLAEVFAVRREVFVDEQNVDAALEYDEYDRAGSEAAHFLLRHDGTAAGTARLIPYHDGFAKLQRVAVLKRFRRLGLGGALVRDAEKFAAAAGYKGIVLHAQIAVKDFYAFLGYEAVSTDTFYEAGIEHIKMSKTF